MCHRLEGPSTENIGICTIWTQFIIQLLPPGSGFISAGISIKNARFEPTFAAKSCHPDGHSRRAPSSIRPLGTTHLLTSYSCPPGPHHHVLESYLNFVFQ